MRKLGVVLLVLLTLSTGCSKLTTLSFGGTKIRAISEADAQPCDDLGAISKPNTNSWQSDEVAREDALNKVLNAAAARGATHVILDGFYSPELTGCPSCVELQARMRRCPSAVKDLPIAEALGGISGSKPPVAEQHHPGHEEACLPYKRSPDSEAVCEFDSQCMLCEDGTCGVPVNRSQFMEQGAACAQIAAEGCPASTSRCCMGRCVQIEQVKQVEPE
ncbi:MAG: hypothetical protein AUK47_15735 [Deltaproteobacteria bacterium CG2_30_63_29]|nr:MAG: hypothetical protein AUK47_15735 [Deltaproteobacteria bacterium CG2_30_63_29]PJB39606.1 MAG: hypothetical protein CO108_16925 [Deltaproteobacteria bacterium CG_4_9_14_3_um_filter_63_12]